MVVGADCSDLEKEAHNKDGHLGSAYMAKYPAWFLRHAWLRAAEVGALRCGCKRCFPPRVSHPVPCYFVGALTAKG